MRLIERYEEILKTYEIVTKNPYRIPKAEKSQIREQFSGVSLLCALTKGETVPYSSLT